jgi:hypothetical protein
MDNRFWALPNSAPSNPHGYTFLTQAFDDVGKAMLGEQWKGDEGKCATAASPSPEDGFVDARRRGLSVREEMIARLEQGTLKSRALGQDGEMAPVPEKHWRSDIARKSFRECRLTLGGPLGAIVENGLVFVETESLGALLLQLPHSKSAEASLPEHLSPYLKCMLLVARKLQISPNNQPKKSVLEAELKDEWKRIRGGEPSPTDLSWMATLLREPESKAGRGAKACLK